MFHLRSSRRIILDVTISNLTDLFASAVPSIVGFISRAVAALATSPVPIFPPIFGTGFFVHQDGVVVTNRHVIEAFKDLPPHPTTNEPSLAAILLTPNGNEWGLLVVDVVDYVFLGSFESSGQWFGQTVPDFGFVQLRVREVPCLDLASEEYYLKVGMDIATIGYPTGTKALTVHNRLNQITPLIRRGIVSSVFPFPTPYPHGFTIDVLQQGGSSGSPIFPVHDAKVVGLTASSVLDTETCESAAGTVEFIQNTNISIAEPAHIIKSALDRYLSVRTSNLTAIPTLQQQIQQRASDAGDGELKWIAEPLIFPGPGR
jgi:S1-C subfamily serine protease